VNEDTELLRVFSHLVLLGNIFSPREPEHRSKSGNDLQEPCGFTIVRSGCTIVDKSRIGESTVTIARYSVEYRRNEGEREKRVFAEGGLAMEEDRFGNLNISIRTKSGPYPTGTDAFQTEAILISGPPTPPLTSQKVKP